jgi:hypothetical protein
MGIFIYSLGVVLTVGSVLGMYYAPSVLWTTLCAMGAFVCYLGGLIKGSEE